MSQYARLFQKYLGIQTLENDTKLRAGSVIGERRIVKVFKCSSFYWIKCRNDFYLENKMKLILVIILPYWGPAGFVYFVSVSSLHWQIMVVVEVFCFNFNFQIPSCLFTSPRATDHGVSRSCAMIPSRGRKKILLNSKLVQREYEHFRTVSSLKVILSLPVSKSFNISWLSFSLELFIKLKFHGYHNIEDKH